jgi:hypothetical protein
VDRTGHVEERLVDRDALDQGREVAEDVDDAVAEALVLGEVPTHEPELRAQLAGAPSRHAGPHAARPCFVGGGEHHPAAHGDGTAAQQRVEQLLDGRVEGVEVSVEDRGRSDRRHRPPL